MMGRSPFLQAVHVTSPVAIGEIADVTITEVRANVLLGELDEMPARKARIA